MKLSVLTVPLKDLPLEEALKYLKGRGVQAVELGTGCFTDDSHCKPGELLKNKEKIRELKAMVESFGMEIAALSCHGNPVHPDPEVAKKANRVYEETVQLAGLLGVGTVVTFSGCPGGSAGDLSPNWVTCPWPPEYGEILDYQWNAKLIPYWEKAAEVAKNCGVRVAIEMHPGFCVYNTDTMLRLREATDDVIGANFDPSHLFWQGMDPVAAIGRLGEAIHYVHAKDCRIHKLNVDGTGVLDTKQYGDEKHRSWLFCTVGYGHGESVWREIMAALRLSGYDGPVSIEHEDSMMSVREGIEKAIRFLKDILIYEQAGEMWWA